MGCSEVKSEITKPDVYYELITICKARLSVCHFVNTKFTLRRSVVTLTIPVLQRWKYQ